MKFNWSITAPTPALCVSLASSVGVSPLMAQCLVNRGITTPEQAGQFLEPKLRSLADPYLLPNMAAAVERLLAARANNEKVVVFGDYDVDGVASTALLIESLRALGWRADFYLPNRMDEGYGLTAEAAESCVKLFSRFLLLAVDCGSTSVESARRLKACGIDVLVLDHHQVSDPPPDVAALVNPQLGGAFRELCSAGLSFKLIHALLKRLRADGVAVAHNFDLRQHLDLAALGTVADLVPLTGENRILAHAGLQHLDWTERRGLRALKSVARVASPVGAWHVGFQLGPRLNAAGRLQDAEEALRLLLCRDDVQAPALARSLDERNRQRQEIERAISEEALEAVRARFRPELDYAIVEGRDSWHIGVVGIVASRVAHHFHRPTIIFGGEGGVWRGSGRSIEGFDLAGALRQCGGLLARHGGHAMAAGLSMEVGHIDSFRARLNDHARAVLKPEHLRPSLRIDAEATLADLTLAGVEELSRLEPCGMANPPAHVALRGMRHRQPPQRLGKESQHVKLRLDGEGAAVEAVWWGCGDAALPEGRFDLAATPTVNEYQGVRTVQLKMLDWQPAC